MRLVKLTIVPIAKHDPRTPIRWWEDAFIRSNKQKKRTDKIAKTIQSDKKLNDYEFSKMLGCSLHEWYILVSHYFGSRYTSLTEDYISYFIYQVMGDDDDKVRDWLVEQRDSFKYASLFEKLFTESEKIPEKEQIIIPLEPIDAVADELKVTEKEYVGLLVEYLGNPPFLVGDYESIDWEI